MVIDGPRGIICYICGRPFGTHSIELHLKECIKRWDWQESLKPKHERRQLHEPEKFKEFLKIK
jgi:hypothetical protein